MYKSFTFDTTKKALMFIAFPSSEVFYVVAIVLAWLYIALGIFGNHQAADQVSPVQNSSQVQEHQISLDKNNTPDSRTFYWVNSAQNAAEETAPLLFACSYAPVDQIKYRNRNEQPRSSYLDTCIPDRAPPSF